MLRQDLLVHEPKALSEISALQSERHQAIVASDSQMNWLGSSNADVTTFECISPVELWVAVCEMIKGNSLISLSVKSKRDRISESICASIPRRVEQQ